MSFFVYLAVLVVAAASALFGLDLLTAPLPPAKPNAQVVARNATAPAKTAPAKADKLDRREAEQRASDKLASNSDRALSPVYPASPGGTKPEVRMVYPPTNAPPGTTGSATSEAKRAPVQAESKEPTAQPQAPAAQATQPQNRQAEQPRQNQASVAPRAADQPATPAEATAKDEPRAPAPPVANNTPVAQPAQPVTQQAANRCDVQACASAYSSFRVSDCTYQPYAGPRRVCEAPPGMRQRSAERARPNALDARAERATRQARRDAELRDVVRSVREMTARDNRDDDAAGYDEPVAGGRRVIILQRGFGWR